LLSAFKKDPCTIVAPDGAIRATPKAQFAGSSLVVIQGTDVVVMPGDEIRRKLPNGTGEAFNVIDPTFYDTGPFGPHFQIKVARKGVFPLNSGGNYTVHVSGPNSRVNIGSQDHSINVAADNVFGEITAALKAGISDQNKLAELLATVEEMKRERGRSGFMQAYQKFVGLAADHIGLVSPFLPALTNLLGP
jgi:hypothetical protein